MWNVNFDKRANYMRPLGKLSLFMETALHLRQTIVVHLLNSEYLVYDGLDAKASTMLPFLWA